MAISTNNISAEAIKLLRQETGAGIMDCKKALLESNGEKVKAIEWLKQNGIAKVAKKENRETTEGVIGAVSNANFGVILEVNCETDFVAKNSRVVALIQTLLEMAVNSKITDLEKFKDFKTLTTAETVKDKIIEVASVMGENVILKRLSAITLPKTGIVVSYLHNRLSPSVGKVGVLVGLISSASTLVLEELGKKIAMQIVVGTPNNLSELLEQLIFFEDNIKVKDLVKKYSDTVKEPIDIYDYCLFNIGQK